MIKEESIRGAGGCLSQLPKAWGWRPGLEGPSTLIPTLLSPPKSAPGLSASLLPM